MRERKHVLSHILGDLLWYILTIFTAVFLTGLVVYQNEPPESLMENESIFTMLTQRETVDGWAEIPTIEELSDYFESQSMDSGEINGQRYERLICSYLLPDGRRIRVMRVSSAVYMETLALSDWVPEIISGYVIGDLPAVYYTSASGTMLVAREGNLLYIIELYGDDTDGQTIYTLGSAVTFKQPAQNES
ncbi:MAG: hypothetical protein IJ719_09845 [Clostridia bacterium]|nr:hypothetical protein [Clostridia bacterium]